MIVGLGWLRLEGERAGLYDFSFGISLMVLLSITVCLVSVASTAAILNKSDLARALGEAKIINLNANLERTVLERTQQLNAANMSLERMSSEDSLTTSRRKNAAAGGESWMAVLGGKTASGNGLDVICRR